MNNEDFHAPQAGRVIQTPRGYLAFIPAPLPPQITYTPELVLTLSRADAVLSELSGLGRYLPNPHLLINSYIWREAVLSSRIEGTRAGLSDLWLDDVEQQDRDHHNADLNEVRNYVRALEFGILRLNELPLSLRLVREIHAHLMEGVRGGQATPGEFRRSQNWIGPTGSTLTSAPYVPPPPDEIMPCLANWEVFLQDRNHFPDLIQCALLHEQFEAVHPFLDGNGRIGRLLITLFIIERQRLTQPLLYLSTYFEAHRQEYYSCLQRVRTEGDWNAWVLFFLKGVIETAQLAVRQAGQLSRLRDQYQNQLREKPKAAALIDSLFINPYMTVARAAQELKVTHPTARQAIKILQDAGILKEVTGREWGRSIKQLPYLSQLKTRTDMNLSIETEDLGKRYGDVRAVEHLSLRVAEGEIYAFLGLNGAGKTTTIRMLLGMIKPTTGYATVLQTRVRLGSREPWASVGYLVEIPHSYPELSVYENLEVARRLHPGTPREAVGRIIERMGLAAYAQRRTGNLSQGNAQRLGLAKALLHSPKLLFLDEPANGLDPAGIVEIREFLLELTHQQGVTVFMSSHILAEVSRLAQRIGIIHNGRLLQELSTDELERNRRRRLLLRVRDIEAAQRALLAAGQPPEILPDGSIELKSTSAVEHPDDINCLLVKAGTPPTQLVVEEEELEQYFLRLVGMEAGPQHE